MRNILKEAKKSFKSRLKNNRKVYYSTGMVISYLLTGGFSQGAPANTESNAKIAEISESLEKQAEKLRAEIKKRREANEQKLNMYSTELSVLEKAGDQAIKSPWENVMTSGMFVYNNMKKQNNNWKYGTRTNTAEDDMRDIVSQYLGYNKGQSGTSGWITGGSDAWSSNTQIYDHTGKLTAIPTINIPQIKQPGTFELELPKITTPLIPGTPSITINPITINVTTPIIPNLNSPSIPNTQAPDAPSAVTVSVVSPNVEVEVGEINITEISDITSPNVSINTPNVSVSYDVKSPSVPEPKPSYVIPNSPEAPNFESFSRGRGNWLGGFSFIKGANNFDRRIKAWEQGPVLIGINSQPFFSVTNGTVRGKGKGSSSKIIAMTDINGNVINRYDDIQLVVPGGIKTGGKPNTDYGPNPPAFQESPEAFPEYTEGSWISAVDDGKLEDVPLDNAPNRGRYQQSWIFQSNPLVENVDIIVGGGKNKSSATTLFGEANLIRMNNVYTELRGFSMIGSLRTDSNYRVEFKDVDININGDSNTLFSTYAETNILVGNPKLADLRNRTDWGRARTENFGTSKTSFIDVGGTKLEASTSKNTVFFVSAPTFRRWDATNAWNPTPDNQNGKVYQTNPNKYFIFTPNFGNIKIQNTDGNVTYTGSENVGVWVANYVPDRTYWVAQGVRPELNLGEVRLQGDKNVAYYLTSHTGRPDRNAVFQGDINVNVKMGTDLDGKGGNIQEGTGNISGNDSSKSEKNVALYAGSGQRTEMNTVIDGFKQYFPATLDFKVDTVTYPDIVGILNDTQIGFPYLEADPITNLTLKDFNVEFGKYSKDGIGIIAKNGTVVDINTGTDISDGAGTETDRATGSVMFYSEGVWFNPRLAFKGVNYDKEAYGRGESLTGKYNIADYNSTINVYDNVTMDSNEAIALYAKDGGAVNAIKDITMNGIKSIGAFAHGVNDITNTILSDGTGAGTQAETKITLENLKMTGTNTDGSYDNIGVTAISQDDTSAGTGKVSVAVNGTLDVKGIGAIARGSNASVVIANGDIKTGVYGGLVAQDGGNIEFQSGKIIHKSTHTDADGKASHENKVVFYADDNNSNINFTGASSLDMHDGILFYGDTKDYSSGNVPLAGETGKYTGMNNVTVNLMDNGVNLGSFKNMTGLVWDSSNSYLNGVSGLKNITKVKEINPNTYWYTSALEGGDITVKSDINRDIMDAANAFNKIIMEKVSVTIDSNATVKSLTSGNGLIMGSNDSSTSNTDSGYTIKGTVDIGDTSRKISSGAYVSFGHITVESSGALKASNGVGAYGVNGSKIKNSGLIEIGKRTDSETGIGIVSLGRRVKSNGDVDDAETYGTDNPLISSKVIDVENEGTIRVTNGSGNLGSKSIGIFVDNNINTAQNRVTVGNSGLIEVGDESVGIQIKGENGGELTLKTKTAGTTNIKVGNKGVGIFTENSKIKFDGDYKFDIGLGGAGIVMSDTNTYELLNNPTLTIINNQTDPNLESNPNFATGMYYEKKEGETVINKFNLNLTSEAAEDKSSIIGMYVKGKQTTGTNITKVINEGTIKAGGHDYGIYVEKGNIENKGNIEVGSDGTGIAVADGSIKTADNLIKVTGSRGLGLYLKGNESTPLSSRELEISGSTGSLEVTGDAGVGAFVSGAARLINNGQIRLSDSANPVSGSEQERKIGIYLKNSKENNESNGNIYVGKDNIGIYGINSNLKNTGKIYITETTGLQNIGAYIKSKGTGNSFEFVNTGLLEVEGEKSIGLHALSEEGSKGRIDLTNGKITVKSSNIASNTNIPLGVYVKGNGINVTSSGSQIEAGANAVGVYIDGTSSLGNTLESYNGEFNLSSSNNNIGIGAYLKAGAQAESGTIKIKSTSSQLTGTSGVVRPIGLLYSENQSTSGITNGINLEIVSGSQEVIGLYGDKVKKLINTGNITINATGIGAYFKETGFENTGKITINGREAYGIYSASDGIRETESKNSGEITLSGEKSIGIITSKKSKVVNNGKINADVSGSIGAYVTENGKFVNDTGSIINSNFAQSGPNSGSTGIVVKGGIAENKGTINSEYLGIYGTNGDDNTQIIQRGNININSGTGIYLKDDGSVNTVSLNLEEGSQIKTKAGLNNISAIVGTGNSKITSNGGLIKVNSNSNGIALIGDTNKTSTLELYGGTIETGENSVGIYSEKAKIVFREDSAGTLNLGKSSTGIYVDKDSSLEGTGKVNIGYNDTTEKGVGIFYKEGTQTNNIEVSQSAGNQNLINIYGENVNLTNNARQIVGTKGLGIYASGTAGKQSIITNNGELNLSGDESIGIYARGNTEIGSLGNITGSGSKNDKIGVFLDGGDITGNQSYDFNIDGGIGVYLKNHIGYTGQINLLGNEYISGGNTYRAIGLIVDKDAGTGNLGAGLKMEGTNGVGIYLASDGTTGADLTYTGKLEMNGQSSEADKGIGVYVNKGATFNLGTGGELNIAGTNNIGFYVAQGGNLNIGNGTVTNTEEGIFAYLEGGNMTFTPGSSNINYANVIVSNGGNLINQTGITTGKSGLQGTGNGSLVLNDLNGIISSNTENAVAMAGEANATVTNNGKIQMSGKGSVGLYVNGATGSSTGEVAVGDNSIAYYAKDKGNTGNILTINSGSITTIGEKSILLAVGEGGRIDYQGGPINLGDNRYGVLIGGSNANGTKSSINFNGHDISVGKDSIAVILDGGELNSTLGNMNIGEKGVGIYSSRDISRNNTLGRTINLSGNAMGIYGENGSTIVLGGVIKSSSEGAKGIININKDGLAGQITNEGIIDLAGEKSIGIYGENINTIINKYNNSVKIGGNSSIGLSGKNVTNVLNEGSIEIKNSGVGIYGEGIGNLRTSGTSIIKSNNESNTTGIYGLSSNVYNEGQIELGDSSNGIYAENSRIENTGLITVGNTGSTGIYGGTGTTIYNNGIVKVGSESVGLATTDGTIINNGDVISTGTGTTYLYTKTGIIENNGNLVLTDYSTGMYSELGEAVNNGKITVGKSDLSGEDAKYSIGMVTERAKIVNGVLGEINVGYDSGVGMFVSGEEIKDSEGKVTGYGVRGTGENYGVINVTGTNGVGIQVTNGGKVYNEGTINITGSSSKGIGATKQGEILNRGQINVTGAGNQGIYVDGGAKINNEGTIKVSGLGNTGIYIGTGGILSNEGSILVDSGANSVIGGGGSMENIGDIVINGLKVTIDGIEIKNTGKITINGELNFENNVILDTSAGQIGTIEVGSVAGNGNIILTLGATQGTNKEIYHVQLIDGLGTIPGGELGVMSQSVSFIGEKHFDSENGQYILTLVKIPYVKLLKNTEAEEFGKGLDQLYTKALDSELKMFDALDMISDKDELARTFDMELRGNIYSNIQDRMMNVNNVFDSAYRQLKNEENPTKKNSKLTAIYVKGNESDKNPGVENYDYNSTGVMYLREVEGLKYGKSLNYSLGFVQSNFDFDQDSRENISSIQTGLGFDHVLSKDSRFKFETRGELGLNYHDTKRKIHLNNGTYTNKTDYFSGTAEVKNYLRYELPVKAKNLDINVFGSLKAGYGVYEGFKESGDGIYLEGKSEDYISVKPGIGLEGKYKIETGKGGEWNFNAGVSYEYELMDIYDDGNRIKIKGTTADYYRLEKPEAKENILKAGTGIEYETGVGIKVGGRVEKTLSEKDEMKYQLDITWKF